ncbi:hypothetical protein N7539_004207 [Penicillium diatomitis]|uniref:Galactose oxidase/kelch, beta-propeller n=1 Tax=Penicillium diatomitis TaxID=2819901 RepID=A0A9W9XDJ8_9EURO|nr:uncharacterized protein N7539_004207 [Penicillium diatomitis]KAJ5489317.1 hypothetical protein N7539_004207 [Penicillium diatomitis]
MTNSKPPSELKDHCLVVAGHTLYAYSADGFFSRALAVNSTWTPLDSGVAVSGAVCVKGGYEGSQNADEALYVVGGTTTKSDQTYTGLQRYSFQEGKWQTLGTGSSPLTGRTGHGAAFIPSTSSIITYAGTTIPGSESALSADAFQISTKTPYTPLSLVSQGAPNLRYPQLHSWNATHLGMFGGNGGSDSIWMYSDGPGWQISPSSLPLDVSLSTPLNLVSGPGDSKIAELFDMHSSPNSVTNYELITPEGQPQSPAKSVGAPSVKRSSDVFPPYNATFAPAQTWKNYALAQGNNGMVVLSNGQAIDSLALYNHSSNSWVNSTEFFQGKSLQQPLTGSTSSSSMSKTTPTATATITPPAITSPGMTTASVTPSSTPAPTVGATADMSSHDRIVKIVGGTLGGACALCFILLFILWLLKRERTKREQIGRPRVQHGSNRKSFQDQGMQSLARSAQPMGRSDGPVPASAHDSFAIFSGAYAQSPKTSAPPQLGIRNETSTAPHKSNFNSNIAPSSLAPSTIYTAGMNRTSATSADFDILPGDRNTDDNWGKYFKDTTGVAAPASQPTHRSVASSIYTQSDYRGSAWPMSTLNPLNMSFLDQPKPLGQVYMGSPTTLFASSTHSLTIPEGQSARISSVDSISLHSEDDPHDTRWTDTQGSQPNRPPSSAYSQSMYSRYTRDLRSDPHEMPPFKGSSRPNAPIPEFPDESPVVGRGSNVNADMSWLNLQTGKI